MDISFELSILGIHDIWVKVNTLTEYHVCKERLLEGDDKNLEDFKEWMKKMNILFKLETINKDTRKLTYESY